MFRPYMWVIFRLRFLTYRLVIQDVWGVCVDGGGDRSRCFNSGYSDLELLEVLPISTVRIQLHVSALYVGHLQFEIF